MAELSAQPTSVQSVYAWYTEDKLKVNRRYQRKLVWTLEEKQRLIESILQRYPVPAILIAEREQEPGTYEIIDGLQRLHAIVSFIETSFPTLDGRIFDLEYFPTAKSRSITGKFEAQESEEKLTQKEVSTLLDYALAFSVMRNATEHEINDVFGRINTYGHRLSDQERRQAGIQTAFSDTVREIACTLRGDASVDVLALSSMPSISIDLPKAKQRYTVKAEEVFWVDQGILRSTDLRDSMDEQCIADIAVCIVTGEMVERSKDALDEVYDSTSEAASKVATSLELYGSNKFAEEFKYCVDEILKVCASGADGGVSLRALLFKKETTNAFPSVFAILLIAFHELIVKESKKISDYEGVRKNLADLTTRIETGRKATSPEERRKNVDVVKGLIAQFFVPSENGPHIYGNHATTDIEAAIRRSEVEVASYELKQGFLSLAENRAVDENVIDKVLKTICAIANNGVNQSGKIIVGVTNDANDAEKIQHLDSIQARKVGKRFVVGVSREAAKMGISVEQYFTKWKNAIKGSGLSDHLKQSVLSSLDFNSFYGLGVLVISIPAQKELSYFNDEVYWREGDSTMKATSPKQIANLLGDSDERLSLRIFGRKEDPLFVSCTRLEVPKWVTVNLRPTIPQDAYICS